MADRRFDVVFLDFYGTVCSGDRAAVEATCRGVVEAHRLEITAAELALRWGERFFDVLEHANHDSFRTLRDCEESSLKDVIEPLAGPIDPRPFSDELDRYWRGAPAWEDAIVFLEKAPCDVCCVSNADREPLCEAISRLGLCFTSIVTSEDARCYKPDPAIFGHAMKAAGVDAGRVIHVGDSLHSDVGGAARAGIMSGWICREERIHDIGDGTPDWIFRDLTELLPLVGL